MKNKLLTILAGVGVIAFLAIFFMRGNQLEDLFKAMENGSPLFIALAFVSQIGKYLAQGMSFHWSFKAVGAEVPVKPDMLLVFQTFFIDTVIPSFNLSGTSVVIEVGKGYGIESGRSTSAALLRQVSTNAAFVVVMVIGFAVLIAMGRFQIGWFMLGLAATLAIGATVVLMVLAALFPDTVLKVLKPVEKMLDKILARLKRHSIDASVKQLVETYSSSAKLMVHNRSQMILEFLCCVASYVFEVLCFAFACHAFDLDGFEIIICIYVVVTLAAMASPIPQGVGVVETTGLIGFSIFGIGQATGLAVIMVYRVICFWLPFVLGAILMRNVSTSSENDPKKT